MVNDTLDFVKTVPQACFIHKKGTEDFSHDFILSALYRNIAKLQIFPENNRIDDFPSALGSLVTCFVPRDRTLERFLKQLIDSTESIVIDLLRYQHDSQKQKVDENA